MYYCDKCEYWVMEGADNGPYEHSDGTYICQGCYEHLVSKFDLDNTRDYASQRSTLTHQEPKSGSYDTQGED